MGLTVYNTLIRKKEPFETVKPGRVGIYLCGPTVYKPSHIGHAVGPIIFDAIKRYLVHRNYQVTWVVNITDVDDKLIIEAQKQGTTAPELATRVTEDYLAAMRELHVDGIDLMPKASEHIGDIVAIVQKLIDKGVAYVSGGDVYFDVTKDSDYGKLSNRNIDEQEGRRPLQSGEKRNARDFALWKAAKPEEPDEVKYDSPWGKGRPGWHIECSAMAMRYLGDTIDIHGGGMDLIFPHHENEIAQSESATNQAFAKYWLHNGLTRVNTKKVSKSDASPEMQAALAKMTLHNLLDRYSGEMLRFFVLSTHYRRPIEYSDEELAGKQKGLDSFYRLFERVERVTGKSPYRNAKLDAGLSSTDLTQACDAFRTSFEQAMDDDFNTAGAIASLFEFASWINRFIQEHKLEEGGGANEPRASARAQMDTPNEPRASARADSRMDDSPTGLVRDCLAATGRLVALARLIGLFIDPPQKDSAAAGLTDQVIQVLIQVRQHLRKNKKDYETADLIRNLLTERGITLEDLPDGTVWRKG